MPYLQYIGSLIYFFAPAYVANAMPPLLQKVNFLAQPIDNNKQLWGMPILGNHKTWRGAVAELLTCSIFTELLFTINSHYQLGIYETIGFPSYAQYNGFLFGLRLGAGIVFGDLFFAFIKRRLKLKPGFPFIPFDQTNYALGACLFLEPTLNLGAKFWLTLFVLTFIIHIVFNRIGYNLGLHKAKW
ncbi:MAG TPA: CDP-archaeol synthase [Candidatus Pacearchaeota archaeon]|nr:CDP-archaeol synthase [Candidatus Pacearchaeota archaeon]HRR94867.1 CDP-archaeol synthase [Candidatus Paceibacterota bacterium]HPC30754.1 CDP-archaeol synthase [Candidatus Pacearchaeota archaeon]HQG09443.1 CDP-archaeol synthase [Candidatus Pacearchaeota archaeon]HQH20288.1 CDP-archaeol synthase [Candidatus Pacearchaeota archaeon]